MSRNSSDDDPGFWYHFRSAFAVILSFTVILGSIGYVGKKAYDTYISFAYADDYQGAGEEELSVRIPTGASVNEVGEILVEEDVVKSEKAFKEAVRDAPNEVTIQAGQYPLKKHMSAAKAVQVLADPDNIRHARVTLTEGLTMDEQFDLLAKASDLPRKDFETAATKNADKLNLPSWAKNRPEGFLFPDTYEIADNPTAGDILRNQTKQFTKVSDTLNFSGQAQNIKQDPYSALTVASILEREARNPKDMKMVSGIIYNRLSKGMPLQSDATVLYANHAKGKLTTTDKQRTIDSPYNTYKVKGLPPGPISNPGSEAMEAAVTPTKSDYLFWVVTDPDKGTTAYAKTAEEHQANVAKFQQWCQDHKGKC